MRRTPLPNIECDTIEIVPHEKRQKETTLVMPERPVPRIDVAEDRPITHEHVMRIDKSVLRGKKDERGLPLAKQGRNLPVHVSLESLPRALRILDALYAALDTAGFVIEWARPYTSPVNVIVLNERIALSISEVIERKQHKITEDDASRQKVDRWWTSPRWDYTCTGRLKFVLESTEASHLQHTWTDGKKQKLESCVGEMFASFETTANAVKKYRQDCAEAARQRAEEQKRAAERRRQEQEYNRKFEVVSNLAQKWQEANRLRDFSIALKESLRSTTSKGEPTFLNLDEPCPSQVFTIVIWGSNRTKFGDPEKKYRDSQVCVTGKITSYRGTPEITASDPTEIEIQK
jgi:hypothetical protein